MLFKAVASHYNFKTQSFEFYGNIMKLLSLLNYTVVQVLLILRFDLSAFVICSSSPMKAADIWRISSMIQIVNYFVFGDS